MIVDFTERLRVLSSNPDDFLQAGFSRKEVAEIFSASALRQAGFSAFRVLKFHTQGINLEKAGYKYDEVKEGNAVQDYDAKSI